MRHFAFVSCLMLALSSCSTYGPSQGTSSMPAPIPKPPETAQNTIPKEKPNYASRMPSTINPMGEKVSLLIQMSMHGALMIPVVIFCVAVSRQQGVTIVPIFIVAVILDQAVFVFNR